MRILLDKTLQILHYKKIDFFALLRNDFNRTLDRVDLLLRRKKIKPACRDKRFISTPIDQLLAPFMMILFWVSLIFSFWEHSFIRLTLILLAGFIFCYLRYFYFLARMKKGRKIPLLLGLLIIDMTAVGAALVIGISIRIKSKLCLSS